MRGFMLAVLTTASVAGAAPATGDQFDGKRSLLCSAFRMFECDLSGGCLPVTAEEIGSASSWTVDFKNKEFTGTTENAQPNAIDRVEVLDGKLFLSGIQDGLPVERDGVAWSVSINNPDGVMTIMVAGEGVGIVGLGSCVTR